MSEKKHAATPRRKEDARKKGQVFKSQEAISAFIMENKPLARALYAQVEIGQGIPADLYKAVAEVLAFVYRLKKRKTLG